MDLIGLIPSFGNLLFTLGAFVVALMVIVAVHEFGHYIVGRWSGIRAEVFSIGFGPVLFSRTDRRGTRWQFAALPLGGYVKFLGDTSAASGRDLAAIEALPRQVRRHTMHGAPLWARAATVAAGPVFNFILSIIVFSAILMARGVPSDPLTIEKLRPVPYTQELRPGDVILSIEGHETPPLDEFEKLVEALPQRNDLDYEVRRSDARRHAIGPHPYPPLAGGVTPGSAAETAGIRAGDVILAADGKSVATFSQLREIVGNSDGRPMRLTVWREGESFEVTLAPKRVDLPHEDGSFETRWLIGITGALVFEPRAERPPLSTALAYGLDQVQYIVRSSVSGLWHVITGSISACNLRGPVGIAQTSGQAASLGLVSFLWFIGVLSTAVGFLNLFPIPVLDGGHLLFHAYEAIRGRPPSDGAMRLMMAIGLALILTLMAFALTNDLTCP